MLLNMLFFSWQDEMGMGKTIQTIALLLSDKKKPSLVIAPTVSDLFLPEPHSIFNANGVGCTYTMEK